MFKNGKNMNLKSILIQQMYYIFSILILSYPNSNCSNVINSFQQIGSNTCNITEHRFIIKLNSRSNTDTLLQIVEKIFRGFSNELKFFDVSDKFSNTPNSFTVCGCMYVLKFLLFSKLYYYTRFVLDSNNEYICLWSFRTTWTGSPLWSADRKTHRIAKLIIKELPGSKIIDIIKVKGHKIERKINKQHVVRPSYKGNVKK